VKVFVSPQREQGFFNWNCTMQIGIFGGTFDPPHLGHLILAECCREAAALDEVWFLVSYKPPHKQRALTRFEHRCEMAGLAITGQSKFRVEPIEKELPPPSYTAETLRELRERHPEHSFSLIIGGDSLNDLPGWYEPKSILEQAKLIAVQRPGATSQSASDLALALNLPVESVALQIVSCPQIDIASRDIRERVSRNQTIRFMVPRSIEEYIRERKLYRES